MGINVSKVLKADAERKARPAPVPNIKSKNSTVARHGSLVNENRSVIVQVELDLGPSKKDLLVAELEKEYTVLKKVRAQISTQSAHLVNEIIEGLRKESPTMADEFLAGNIPMPELATQYQKIVSITDDQLAPLYDKIQHVKMYGELPGAAVVNEGPLIVDNGQDVKAIQYEIRRLDDLIHKTYKKIELAKGGIKAPTNSERVNDWKNKIAMAESNRTELKTKLKNIQYEARGKRIGD